MPKWKEKKNQLMDNNNFRTSSKGAWNWLEDQKKKK